MSQDIDLSVADGGLTITLLLYHGITFILFQSEKQCMLIDNKMLKQSNKALHTGLKCCVLAVSRYKMAIEAIPLQKSKK